MPYHTAHTLHHLPRLPRLPATIRLLPVPTNPRPFCRHDRLGEVAASAALQEDLHLPDTLLQLIDGRWTWDESSPATIR